MEGGLVLDESRYQVKNAHARIGHCLGQLQDEDLWWNPGEGCNCIGVVVQHLLGNLHQWIVAGVGGEADTRDRQAEFRVAENKPREALMRRLDERVEEVLETYSGLRVSSLLDERRIEGSDVTVLHAIFGTMTHFELHAGQIVYVTRLRLGRAYVERWKPATKEEGA